MKQPTAIPTHFVVGIWAKLKLPIAKKELKNCILPTQTPLKISILGFTLREKF